MKNISKLKSIGENYPQKTGVFNNVIRKSVFLGALNMKSVLLIWFILILLSDSSESGSQCPSWKEVSPCFCSNFNDQSTLIICHGIQNTSHLEEVTQPFKSLIVERLVLLNTFADAEDSDEFYNAIDVKTKIPLHGMFPRKWLAELRVRELEIQNARLNGYFLTDDALEGQRDFLTNLIIKGSNLRGHVCSICMPGSAIVSLSTKELKRTPLLKYIDFSYNQLEMLDGNVFPSNLKELAEINLSYNRIHHAHDGAFSNLQQLKYLDLSNNRLTSINRKLFRNPDNSLVFIDLSYNKIQWLPNDTFQSMNALKEMRITHNLLEILPETTWLLMPVLMETVDLTGNFLVCNCSMKWIAARRSASMTRLIGKCVAPKEAAFKELKRNMPSISSCG